MASSPSTDYDAALLASVGDTVVGRRRELESVVAALAAGRHLLLEGPPGTGKSTLLRTIAHEIGAGFEFVEGNAELTPARLIGAFDPAAVLDTGYSPDVFIDGPLTVALREGSLLYIEEINRVPEETLNVLISVMSEGELHIPRVGHVAAEPGFRLVAAMNPFDAVGTARISGAVYDRCCRLAMHYQSSGDEMRIVANDDTEAAAHVGAGFVAQTVDMVRATREHPDLRTGSSVRGAIDVVVLSHRLADLRNVDHTDASVTRDACQLALSGRVRVREGSGRTGEEVVDELWQKFFDPNSGDTEADTGDGGDQPPKG